MRGPEARQPFTRVREIAGTSASSSLAILDNSPATLVRRDVRDEGGKTS